MTTDPLELIRGAKPKEGTVPICLRLDLVGQHEDLLRELGQTEKARLVNDSLTGNPAAIELAEKIVDLEEEMKAATIVCRLRSLPRIAWGKMVAEHPPRRVDGTIIDADFQGVNSETFPDAMLRACLVYPELSDEDYRLFVDVSINSAQHESLTDEAWSLNRGKMSVPFSVAASLIHPASGSESKRQDSSASASNGSKAGKPRKSRSTSTAKTDG